MLLKPCGAAQVLAECLGTALGAWLAHPCEHLQHSLLLNLLQIPLLGVWTRLAALLNCSH